MKGYKVVVTKSTVPVGTADQIRAAISKETTHPFSVVSNPEFLKEGSAISDFMKPPRVVLGTDDPQAEKIIKELYEPFNRTGNPVILMSNRSAEVAKYAANAMLATRISFMNELAGLCEKVGANIDEVRHGLATDPRIGDKFLFPGVGYGGSCFPKDVKAIIRTAQDHHCQLTILDAVEAANARQKKVLFEKAMVHYQGKLKGKQFAVWGLAFKPNTDDMREAPSVELIRSLLAAGAVVTVHDPVAMDEARKIFGESIQYATKNYDTLTDADGLFIVTEWNEFRYPDFERMKSLMRESVIFDGRNLYDQKTLAPYAMKAYYSIGRG
jgi:UDPglucose 6-dehydrogenase